MDSREPEVQSGLDPEAVSPPPASPVSDDAPDELGATDGAGAEAAPESAAEAAPAEAPVPVSPPSDQPAAAPTRRSRAASRPSTGRLWAAAEDRRSAQGSAPGSAGSERSTVGEAEEAVEEAEQAVLEDLAKLASERDDYLDQLRRVKADFENYRKRIIRQQTEHLERAAEGLAEKLLPVLDTFDAALAHGQGFEQVHGSLMSTLEKEGLERIYPLDKPFDPTEADAVAHEEGDDGPVVTEVLRSGYRWKGRVLRPAMVRVRG